MARVAKSVNSLQVFRGSLAAQDVFAANSGSGCCGVTAATQPDKLGDRVRFDNALAHSNPLGGNDKFSVPGGNGFSGISADIIAHINAIGVGAQVSVLAIPTYAFLKGVGIHIAAAEAGLTFNLVTRNGLALPFAQTQVVDATAGASGCAITRTATAGTAVTVFAGFGALAAGVLFEDIFGYDGQGKFSVEADELILQVATMPAGGVVAGTFSIDVTAHYEVIHRAEQ